MEQLLVAAFYFFMRSCENSRVTENKGARRNKLLRVQNIRFFQNGKKIAHTDLTLSLIDYGSIPFKYQK